MANTHSLDLESGSSQYAYIADGSQTGLDITGDMTLECWVNYESLTGGEMTILGKYESSGNQRSYLLMWNDTGNNMQFYVSADGTAVANTNVAWTPTPGIWYHIALAYDASAGSTDFYVNGSQEGTTQSGLATSVHNGTANFAIGSYNTGSTPAGFFDGLIDEVRVWNDIRTPTEISANYNKTLTGTEAGLVAYYKLDNGYLDETSNNNDLAASGSPTFSTTIPFSEAGATSDKEVNSTDLLNDANLQAYWRFENDWTDSSSNSHTLTASNVPRFTAGKFGQGASFTATADTTATIGDASCTALSTQGSQTWAFWIKFDALTDANYIWGKMASAGNAGTYCYGTSGGAIEINDTGITGDPTVTGITTGTWYHVALVYDQPNSKSYGYLNGNLNTGPTNTSGTWTDNSGYDFGIGGAIEFTGRGTFQIDDFAMFDKALSAGEVRKLFQAGGAFLLNFV